MALLKPDEIQTIGRRLERGESTLLPDPVLEELWCPLISVDDHVLEAPDMFEGRVPHSLADAAPKLIDDENGLPHWVFEDQRLAISLANGSSGRPLHEQTMAAQKYSDFRRGVWDVHTRILDMDVNGVWASLCFPAIPFGFAGTAFNRMKDPELGLACLRAYNDWLIEEWCGAYPDRFIPCQLPWMADPTIAAQEIVANAERGYRAVSFSENPEKLGFPHLYGNHWDTFFQACEETDTVINLHVGSSGSIHRPSSYSPGEVTVALFPLNGMEAIADWIYSKVAVRYPRLKIVLSEAGVSWVPMMIERLGRAWRQRDASTWWTDADPNPVDVLHRNFWFTSIEDPSAFRVLDLIGPDKVMLESDYPHGDSSWPETQAMFKRDLGHLDVETIERICFRTAGGLYRHPEPPADLLASSTIGHRKRQEAVNA